MRSEGRSLREMAKAVRWSKDKVRRVILTFELMNKGKSKEEISKETRLSMRLIEIRQKLENCLEVLRGIVSKPDRECLN